jgi:hypothetical protein
VAKGNHKEGHQGRVRGRERGMIQDKLTNERTEMLVCGICEEEIFHSSARTIPIPLNSN